MEEPRLLAGPVHAIVAAAALAIAGTAAGQTPVTDPTLQPGAATPGEPAAAQHVPQTEPPAAEPAESVPEQEPEPEPEGEPDDDGFGFGEEEEGSKFKFNGYIQSQAGIFIAPDEEVTTPTGVRHHGGKLGEMSMFRNTLQLEADWTPAPPVAIHAIFRGVRSLKVDADKDAQPPDPKKRIMRPDSTGAMSEAWVALSPDELREFVRDKYYTETDIRELYVDINATDWLNFRVGKQQVSWGETGQFRLLDVVNPVDSTWHFGALESFEDQRIPLWMLNTTIDIPPMQGNLQVVWIPMLNDPEELVTIPLTFVGAWGLPPPVYGSGDPVPLGQYRRKVFMYPGADIENSRAGARWKGEIGNFTYSLVYFYTHVITPPIPQFTRFLYGGGDLEVYSGFPRQHIAGLALETTLPNPITLNLKFEAAIEPDRTYPVSSQKPTINTRAFTAAEEYRGVLFNAGEVVSEFDNPKKKVLSYALTLQRPTSIPWLNPEQTIMFVGQFMHTWILDWDKDDRIVEIPGYDTTLAREHSFKLIGSIFTSYLHGILTPKVVAVFALGKMPGKDDVYQGGLVSASLGVTLGNHWRGVLALNEFFGPDAYDGLGLFRDRDEVNLLVRYQF